MAPVAARPVTVVRLPADPTGRHLADVVRTLHQAMRTGDVVLDSTGVSRTSPGLTLALRRLRRQARALGCTWQDA